MTGLELLKAPEATAGEIADIISAPCPPTIPAHCDGVSCRECWLTWLTGEPPEEKGPSDEQTAPCGGCPLQGKKRELIQLGRLLKEVGEYVNSSPSRTSHRGSCNYRDQREKARGDLGILGKPLREPSLHFIDNLFREFLHINHRQHPLPGQRPSSIIHEREGKGKEQQNV